METELRDRLLVTTSALQAVVVLLAKKVRETDPGFVEEAEKLLTDNLKHSDERTRTATIQALRNLLSA